MLPVARDNLGETTHISRLVMWSELKPEPEERPGTGPVSASDLLCDLSEPSLRAFTFLRCTILEFAMTISKLRDYNSSYVFFFFFF